MERSRRGFERWRPRTLRELRKPPQAATLRVRGEGQPPRRKPRSRPLSQARHAVGATELRAMWRSRTNRDLATAARALPRLATARHAVRARSGCVGHCVTSGAMQSCSYAERTEACNS